ncbi:MAG: (Fe-S)-binding protein [Thermoplasmatales archaeon]
MDSRLEKQLFSVRKVLVESLNKNFVPFPVDKSLCSAWTQSLPYGGETIIYTSCMYQLSNLFKSYEKFIPTLSELGGSSRFASLGKYFIKPKREELERSYKILNNISSLLVKSGISHGYLYDDEPYSGGLLLELGMIDEFRDYGKKVLAIFKEKEVKRVVTVDPHTYNALLRLKKMHNSDLIITNYLALVSRGEGSGEFVFHDPCLYTRYNDLGGTIREVLGNSGIKLIEDRMVTSREYGTCCGGPLGPVDLSLSDSIAEYRSKKLLSVSENVLVACPLCYQNLAPHIPHIKDVAEVIR